MGSSSDAQNGASCADCEEQEIGRREFLAYTAGAMGAVGASCAAWPLINSMNPAADTLALSTAEVDLSNLKTGESMTAVWRGKPVFIRNRTQKEIDEARAVDVSELRDPETDQQRFKNSTFGGKELPFLVVIGICTHLGCVPLGQKPTDPHGSYDGWFCPCHGSQYDSSGRIRKGPAPKNLEVPPYQFTDATHIKIG